MLTLLCRFVDGVHDVKHMKGKLTGGALWRPCSKRVGHICHANPPAIRTITMRQRDLGPCWFTCELNTHRSTKSVRVGQAQRAFRTINFQTWNFCAPHVECSDYRTDRPAGKFKDTYHMSRHIHTDGCAVLRLAGDVPFWEADPS